MYTRQYVTPTSNGSETTKGPAIANSDVPKKQQVASSLMARRHFCIESTLNQRSVSGPVHIALVGFQELRKLRQLKDENVRLKRLVADLTLDKHILQEVISKKL